MTITTWRWDIDLLYLYPIRRDIAWPHYLYRWCRWLVVPHIRLRRNDDWPCYQLHVGCLYLRYWWGDWRWSAPDQMLVRIPRPPQ